MGQPRSYALGVLLERLHNDTTLGRLDSYCAVGQTPQERAKIKRRRDRKARRNVNERVKIIHKRNDTIRKLRKNARGTLYKVVRDDK